MVDVVTVMAAKASIMAAGIVNAGSDCICRSRIAPGARITYAAQVRIDIACGDRSAGAPPSEMSSFRSWPIDGARNIVAVLAARWRPIA
jgi:hypothetical protein